MKKSFKKIFASFLAISTLAVGMTGLNASAGTIGNPSTWNMYQPEGNNKLSDSGTVTGMRNGVDIGVRFKLTSKSGTVEVKGDLNNYAIKRNPNEFAYVSSVGSTSTCLFIDNWYNVNGGSNVGYTVRAINYGLFSANGTAD